MAIADKVTSITNHLIADYEELENVGAEINDDKNIENIAYYLQGIYDNLPKTTGEDTNLSLNTLKGKMNIIPKGDTQQTQYSGYNLLNLTLSLIKGSNTSGTWNNNVYTISGLTITINEDMTIKVNGTATAQVTLIINGGTIPYATGTYYLSGARNGSNDLYDVRIFNCDGTSGVAQCFTGTRQVNIVNNSQSFNMAVVIRNGVTCNNTIFYPMLSTTNTSDYEPYVGGTASPNPTYPQNIEVVTGTQNVKVENVNLLKLQTLTEQTTNGITFTPHYENGLLQYINVNGTATSTVTYNLQGGNHDTASTYPCSIKQGGYTLSGYLSSTNNYKAIFLRYTYDNSTFTTISATTKTSVTFTQDCKIASYIRIQGGYTANNEKVYPQLEKGSTATTYTPHQEQTQIVELSSKNLLDVSSITTPITINGITLTPKGNGTFELKGIATTANAGFVLGKCKFTNGTNYTISNGLSDNAYGKYTMLIPTYAAWGNNTLITGTSTTFQAKSSEEFNIEMVIYNGTDISSGITITPQLEEGSSATPFEEYYNYELCKIGNYQDYLYKTSGKNLLDESTLRQGSYAGASNSRIYFNSNYYLEAGTYTFITNMNLSNFRFAINVDTRQFPLSGGQTINVYDSTWKTSQPFTFTISQAGYLGVGISKANGTDNITPSDIANYNFMIYKGAYNSNQKYEPYGSGKWYKKENVYKIANKTNWSVDNVASNNRAVISLSGNGFPYSSDIGYATANAISNNFVGISQLNQASTTSINNIAINNANMYIKFDDTINTKALVKEQLDSMTNLEIYYVVATPQDIEITNTTLIEQLDNLEKLKSYNGVTNISSSGNLSAILGVSALKGE